MRKLMWFTIGFAGACALGEYLGFWCFVAAAAVLIGGVVLWKTQRSRCWAVLLGLLVGFGWFVAFDLYYTAPVRALDGKTVKLSVEAYSYSWETDYGSAVDGSVRIGGIDYRIRLYLNEPTELEPGDRIVTPVKLRLTAEGGRSEPTFHRSNGILLLGYQRETAEFTYSDTTRLRHFPAFLRRELIDIINEAFSSDTAGFARALLLGDKTGITYEQSSDFSVSGISHIVAVSGLHMSILMALLATVISRRRYLLAGIGIPVILLFMSAAAFTPSVTRAGIMQILMILALCLRREYDPPTALSFSALVMLAVNPLVISSVGFQLSIASVAGIFLFAEPIRGWMEDWIPEGKGKGHQRLRRWFCGGVSVTLSAQFMTVPLVALYFGTVSLIGVFTNLVVLWVVSGVFYGITAVCAVGAVWMTGAKALAWVVSFLIRFVLSTARLAASVPLAAVYTESIYIVLWLVASYAMIALFLFGRKKRPGICFALSLLGLSLALGLGWGEPLLDESRVTALDVGQGQCVILQKGAQTYVVDCGGDYDDDAADRAAEYLLSMGISRIDGLIVTHYDGDHAGGVPGLLHRIRADAIYLPGFSDEHSDAIREKAGDARVISLEQDILIQADGLKLTLFAPESGTNDGQNGIAVLFQAGKCDTLILGDRSAASERRLVETGLIPKLELLVAGHHGAKSATSLELISAVAPDAVIISAGRDNRYNHPHGEVLELLELAGCQILRTDEMGDILCRR